MMMSNHFLATAITVMCFLAHFTEGRANTECKGIREGRTCDNKLWRRRGTFTCYKRGCSLKGKPQTAPKQKRSSSAGPSTRGRTRRSAPKQGSETRSRSAPAPGHNVITQASLVKKLREVQKRKIQKLTKEDRLAKATYHLKKYYEANPYTKIGFRGKLRQAKRQRYFEVLCDSCEGSGFIAQKDGEGNNPCPKCKEAGFSLVLKETQMLQKPKGRVRDIACTKCYGKGERPIGSTDAKRECDRCHGTQRINIFLTNGEFRKAATRMLKNSKKIPEPYPEPRKKQVVQKPVTIVQATSPKLEDSEAIKNFAQEMKKDNLSETTLKIRMKGYEHLLSQVVELAQTMADDNVETVQPNRTMKPVNMMPTAFEKSVKRVKMMRLKPDDKGVDRIKKTLMHPMAGNRMLIPYITEIFDWAAKPEEQCLVQASALATAWEERLKSKMVVDKKSGMISMPQFTFDDLMKHFKMMAQAFAN